VRPSQDIPPVRDWSEGSEVGDAVTTAVKIAKIEAKNENFILNKGVSE